MKRDVLGTSQAPAERPRPPAASPAPVAPSTPASAVAQRSLSPTGNAAAVAASPAPAAAQRSQSPSANLIKEATKAMEQIYLTMNPHATLPQIAIQENLKTLKVHEGYIIATNHSGIFQNNNSDLKVFRKFLLVINKDVLVAVYQNYYGQEMSEDPTLLLRAHLTGEYTEESAVKLIQAYGKFTQNLIRLLLLINEKKDELFPNEVYQKNFLRALIKGLIGQTNAGDEAENNKLIMASIQLCASPEEFLKRAREIATRPIYESKNSANTSLKNSSKRAASPESATINQPVWDELLANFGTSPQLTSAQEGQLATENSGLKAENDRLKSELKESRQQLLSLQEKTKALEKSAAQNTTFILRQNTRIDELSAERKPLDERNQVLQETLEKTQKIVFDRNQEISDLRQINQSLSDKEEELRKKLGNVDLAKILEKTVSTKSDDFFPENRYVADVASEFEAKCQLLKSRFSANLEDQKKRHEEEIAILNRRILELREKLKQSDPTQLDDDNEFMTTLGANNTISAYFVDKVGGVPADYFKEFAKKTKDKFYVLLKRNFSLEHAVNNSDVLREALQITFTENSSLFKGARRELVESKISQFKNTHWQEIAELRNRLESENLPSSEEVKLKELFDAEVRSTCSPLIAAAKDRVLSDKEINNALDIAKANTVVRGFIADTFPSKEGNLFVKVLLEDNKKLLAPKPENNSDNGALEAASVSTTAAPKNDATEPVVLTSSVANNNNQSAPAASNQSSPDDRVDLEGLETEVDAILNSLPKQSNIQYAYDLVEKSKQLEAIAHLLKLAQQHYNGKTQSFSIFHHHGSAGRKRAKDDVKYFETHFNPSIMQAKLAEHLKNELPNCADRNKLKEAARKFIDLEIETFFAVMINNSHGGNHSLHSWKTYEGIIANVWQSMKANKPEAAPEALVAPAESAAAEPAVVALAPESTVVEAALESAAPAPNPALEAVAAPAPEAEAAPAPRKNKAAALLELNDFNDLDEYKNLKKATEQKELHFWDKKKVTADYLVKTLNETSFFKVTKPKLDSNLEKDAKRLEAVKIRLSKTSSS